MYIKLTRLDNSPIWLNAAFIVTIEPRKQGGSTVVPIGDGLDYDVRETAEEVLAMLAGEPAPSVVPVPPPKSLVPQADDVSPDPEPAAEKAVAEDTAPAGKAKKARKTTTRKPATKTRARKTEALATSTAEDATAEVATTAKDAPTEAPTATQDATLTDEQIERIRRMAPGSIKKLANTLSSQFKITAFETAIRALEKRGVLTLDGNHIVWKQPTSFMV